MSLPENTTIRGGVLQAYRILPEDAIIDVTPQMTPVELGGTPVETLVFPNAEDEFLTVSVTVRTSDGGLFTDTYEIPAFVAGEPGAETKPFLFLSNHEYTLQLTVMTDQVRIVAVVPQKYDWIDVDADAPALGNPIVFANAVWLDRNLGANGYEIDNPETYGKSVGFFYQTCRNVPYWPFAWKQRTQHYTDGNPTAKDRYKVPLNKYNITWGDSDYRPYPIVSERLQPYLNIPDGDWCKIDGYSLYNILEPEEAEALVEKGASYAFVGDGGLWWSKNGGDISYHDYWDNPDNHPSPPGWRIPTKEQLMTIFPSTPFAGNIGFYSHGDNTNPSNWNADGHGFLEESVQRICVPYYRDNGVSQTDFWEKFDNNIGCIPGNDGYAQGPGEGPNPQTEPDGDPSLGYHSVYVISREGTDLVHFDYDFVKDDTQTNDIGTIYSIKKVGTSEAYRMRWKVIDVAEPGAEYPVCYIEVNTYSCKSTDNLTTDSDSEHYFKNYDWEHPAASMKFPLSGLIEGGSSHKGALCYYGMESIYATSTVDNDKNGVLRMKVWGKNDGRNLYIAVVNENVNHGKQIRLIRE